MNIGDTIKSLRQEKGYSQKELATALNISASCLCKYEANRAQIPAETLISIADIFNVSLDYLFGRSNFAFDYDSLNTNYVNKVKTYTMLNEALSLNASNRKIHLMVLKALKCQSDIEQMKVKF